MERALLVLFGLSSIISSACSFDGSGTGNSYRATDAGAYAASDQLGGELARIDLPLVVLDGVGPPEDSASLVDLGVDLIPSPDTVGPDTTTNSPPCAGGVVVDLEISTKMVICRGVDYHDQCSAESVCNTAGGWHLCSAGEYLKLGGKTVDPGNREGWLASCVRSGNDPHAPTNAVCSSCWPQNGWWEVVEYSCDGYYGYQIKATYVGIGISGKCRRVGENKQQLEGYWEAVATFVQSQSAVCCRA